MFLKICKIYVFLLPFKNKILSNFTDKFLRAKCPHTPKVYIIEVHFANFNKTFFIFYTEII